MFSVFYHLISSHWKVYLKERIIEKVKLFGFIFLKGGLPRLNFDSLNEAFFLYFQNISKQPVYNSKRWGRKTVSYDMINFFRENLFNNLEEDVFFL